MDEDLLCQREFRNKRHKQYYLSLLVDLLAGKPTKAIAESLHVTEESVLSEIEYVKEQWSRAFPSNDSGNVATQPGNSDLSDPLLTTATCHQCKLQIKPGDYRVVVAAAELGTVPPGIDPSRIGGRRRFLAFCARCSFGIIGDSRDEEGETCYKNPLVRVFFGSTRKQIADDIAFNEQWLREVAEEAKLMDAGRQARENELIAAVRYAADTPQAGATPSKKDDRLLMTEYLLSPEASALKLFQRRAAELYSQGKTQAEIERALGRDQTTVSRTLRDLKAKAYVWAQQDEKTKTAGLEKQLNAMFSNHPRYEDAMGHASTVGSSIERA